jgi:hypothetical protein
MKLLLFFLLMPIAFKSQINIDYSIKKIDGTRKHILKINIVNNTDKNYILPIDTTGFRVYYPDEPSSNFYYDSADRGLGIMPLFKYNKEYIMGESRSHHLQEIDVDNSLVSRLDGLKRNNENNLIKWMKKYNINDELSAKKNMYLFKHIIFLKPHQNFSFEKVFDFLGFNETELYYNMYPLEPERVYEFSLSYHIDKKIYSNLTKEQKISLRGYTFFSGTVNTKKEVPFSFTKKEDLEY